MAETERFKKVTRLIPRALMLVFLTACQVGAAAETAPPLVSTETRTAIPNEITLPTTGATSTAEEQRTVPPMLVLTQPTAETPLPQVSTTAGVRKPSLVQINSPGPGSKVRDFIWVRVNVYPGDGGNVHLLLTGEDGREIDARDLTYSQWNGGWLSIAEQLFFAPAAASEKALLSVYTLDWYGRINTWSSVEILMLQIGREEIEQPGFQGDPFVVNKPQAGSLIAGGNLHLEGYVHLTQAGKTTLELVAQDGSVIAWQELQPPTITSSDQYAAFDTDLSYQVQKRTPIRLLLKQTSPEYDGQILAASSLILYLDP
jgi:hypothetical protein